VGITTSRSVVWVDANGNKTISRISSNTGATVIQGNILNCSEADFLEYWESAVTANATPIPPGGSYRGVLTRAALLFLCADNTQATVLIPCPSLSIFLADQETVDAANVFVAALITACIGNLESATGSLAVSYLGGYLLPGARSPL